MIIESISDSSDSDEEQSKKWRRLSKKPSMREVQPPSGTTTFRNTPDALLSSASLGPFTNRATVDNTSHPPPPVTAKRPHTARRKKVSSKTEQMVTKLVHTSDVPSSLPPQGPFTNREGENETASPPPTAPKLEQVYKPKPTEIVDMIDDSSSESSDSQPDSDSDSDNDSVMTAQSDSGALTQLLTINQRHSKPQHPNLITQPAPAASFSVTSLPPRHPHSSTSRPQGGKPPSQLRVSPTPLSGMSSSSHQSALQKGLLQWRRRLWPSLTAFYRILLRCHCLYTPSHQRTSSSLTPATLRENDALTDMQHGDLTLQWGSFWDPSALTSLSVHFSSVTEHNRQLFLLLLEECRCSMTTLVTRRPDIFPPGGKASGHNSNHNYNKNKKELRWQRGEVKSIVTNLRDSQSSLSSSASLARPDPRLGTLWMFQVQLLAPKRSRSGSELSTTSIASNPCQEEEKSRLACQSESGGHNRERGSSASFDQMEGYRPGDLLACRHPTWGNRLALGVVQGFDPDYDILLKTSGDDCVFTTVHLLMCVDATGSEEDLDGVKEPSGWLDIENMPVCQGTLLQLSLIGNIITSLRECQAISSLASLHPSLREMILCRPGACYDAGSMESKASEAHSSVKRQQACPIGVSAQLWTVLSKRYNPSQLQAITSVVEKPRAAPQMAVEGNAVASGGVPRHPFVLLQGPPGTGKTSTIMGIIAVLLDTGVPSDSSQQQGKKIRIGSSLTGMAAAKGLTQKTQQKTPQHAQPASFAAPKTRILLCAPSNTAVDELVYRLKKHGVLGRDGCAKRSLTVVRIGQPLNTTRATSADGNFVDVKEFTLDYLVDRKRREIESAPQSGYRRTYVPNTLQLRRQVLEQADIVCCTLSGSGSAQLLEAIMNNGAPENTGGRSESSSSGGKLPLPTPFRFDVVIIDEAAQAVEPSALIPLKYNPKVLIMVGDACQLRATVLSQDATKFNFGRSLFERLDEAGHPKQMLLTQYRMHPDIARFPSDKFYGGRLTNDSGMLPSRKCKGSHWKPFHEDRSTKLRPLVFHNVKHGREELSGLSYCNRAEADYIVNLYGMLRRLYSSTCSGGVGVITAYKAQTHLLKKKFRQQFGPSRGGSSEKDGLGCDVEISTIDGFQGREKDIIIFSCVRSSSNNAQSRSNVGFMNDSQRLNVALTRAKFGLWIVGDVRTMESSGRGKTGIWRDLVEHCRHNGFIYDPK